ncbi:MAG: rhodanese-like domain-containing protein [Betaproteobacteria bacterium]
MRTVQQVAAAQFAQWRDAHAERQPLLLDVREPWEVQTASVRPDGFELCVIAMGDIPAQLGQLPKDRPIACLCHHGMRSLQVAHFLQQQGYTDVVNVQGGIDAWSVSLDPSVTRY